MPQPGRPDPGEGERHAEPARPSIQERQIEAVQVVVLDHVRIGGPDARDQPRQERGLGGVTLAGRLEHVGHARGVADRDHEDAIPLGIEPGRLEIDLHPVELVE